MQVTASERSRSPSERSVAAARPATAQVAIAHFHYLLVEAIARSHAAPGSILLAPIIITPPQSKKGAVMVPRGRHRAAFVNLQICTHLRVRARRASH